MQNDFKIDDDIPAPQSRGDAAPLTRYMKMLKVGQSFFAPGVTNNQVSNRTSQIRRQSEFQNWRWTTAKRTENGVVGIRIWRIEDETPEEQTPEEQSKT